MEALDKLTQYNVEAEEMVIGSIFLEPELIKETTLQPDDFTPGPNWNIWYTFLDLDKKGKHIDLVTLMDRLNAANKSIEDVGGLNHISTLATSVPSTSNFQRYCEIVKDHSRTRQALATIKRTEKEILEGADTVEAIKRGRDALQSIEDSGTTKFDGSIKQGLMKLFEMVMNADGTNNGITTGFKDLDRILKYKPTDLVIVGARPSIGKTAYAINQAQRQARSPMIEEGDVVGIFSLETLEVGILKRFAASIGNIDLEKMKTAAISFTSDDWKRFNEAMRILSEMDLEIFDEPRADINFIRTNIKEMIKKFPGRNIVVYIDYLQLITGDPIYRNNRTQEVNDISRNLKLMAMELKVTIIALAQLSRGVEQRQDKRPIMSDLKESGSIEQDADVIQFLFREDYYDRETENKNLLEVIVAKQRDGATGTVSVAFLKEFGKMVNIDWGEHQK